HQRTHAANALPTIRVESDRVLAARDQALVDHVQHLKKGHVRYDIARLISLEEPGCRRALLSPNFEGEIHRDQIMSGALSIFIYNSVCSCGLLRKPTTPCAIPVP